MRYIPQLNIDGGDIRRQYSHSQVEIPAALAQRLRCESDIFFSWSDCECNPKSVILATISETK